MSLNTSGTRKRGERVKMNLLVTIEKGDKLHLLNIRFKKPGDIQIENAAQKTSRKTSSPPFPISMYFYQTPTEKR